MQIQCYEVFYMLWNGWMFDEVRINWSNLQSNMADCTICNYKKEKNRQYQTKNEFGYQPLLEKIN